MKEVKSYWDAITPEEKRCFSFIIVLFIAVVLIAIGAIMLCNCPEADAQEITSVTRYKNGDVVTRHNNGINILITKDKQVILNNTNNGRAYVGFTTERGYCLKPIGTTDYFYRCELYNDLKFY